MTAAWGVEQVHGLGWRIGWTAAALVPFVAVTAVQLVSKFTNDARVDSVTKALEIPTLAVGIGAALLTTRRTPRVVVGALLFVGLALSWVGDVALNSSFVLGLGSFLAAHLVYVVLFTVAFRRSPSRWALLAIPWWLTLVVVLGPRLGGMLPLVALYAAVLGLMAAWSTRGNALTIAGALLFVVSDTLLAFRLFSPWVPGDVPEFLVMLAYLAAQTLIAAGILQTGRASSTSGSPVSSSRAVSPSSTNPQRS